MYARGGKCTAACGYCSYRPPYPRDVHRRSGIVRSRLKRALSVWGQYGDDAAVYNVYNRGVGISVGMRGGYAARPTATPLAARPAARPVPPPPARSELRYSPGCTSKGYVSEHSAVHRTSPRCAQRPCTYDHHISSLSFSLGLFLSQNCRKCPIYCSWYRCTSSAVGFSILGNCIGSPTHSSISALRIKMGHHQVPHWSTGQLVRARVGK